MSRIGRRGLGVMGLLAVLPVIAHAPALLDQRLLGPGKGATLHLPLRAAVWSAWHRGEIPVWNPTIFSGTPLLASYHPGAFYPPMVLLSALPAFAAFQILVLFSLGATAVLTFLYLRRLGAHPVGAYFSGLSFALGPYLLGHLDDTATVVAAPMLPLVLLAAESHMNRWSLARAAGLAASLALLLLAGSPEAARAGAALAVGRLLVGHLFPRGARQPRVAQSLLALGAGLALAAPQVLPTLLVLPEAGRQITTVDPRALPGITGLILRYVSHTPAPSLVLAALPLALTQTPVRVLGVALGLCLGLQWGRGPLAAPGALALVFDLTLAVLAGLSLSAQWETRRLPLGRRLRAYFLFASLASAAALSVAAAVLGPLPQTLAGAVGVLAMALILYFSLAASPDPVIAGVWLLPLTVSFLLQPQGRQVWRTAPTRPELVRGTPTRDAVDRALGLRRSERILTLTESWPPEALDLAFGGLGGLVGRRSVSGDDPLVSLRYRGALGGMGADGTLRRPFFRTDPERLDILGVRWVQVPASALRTQPDAFGLGDTLDLPLLAGDVRFFPVPMAPATELTLGSWLADSVGIPDRAPVALAQVRLASGRLLPPMPILAGRDTAEWAWDRPDVRRRVAHARAPILESWTEDGFEGHRYVATLRLPGRFYVDGIRLERLAGPGLLTLARLGLRDRVRNESVPVSLASGYVSDTGIFQERVATPAVRLYELPRTVGPAHVVERLRVLADESAVRAVLAEPRRAGFDPRIEAMATTRDAAGSALAAGRASRASLVSATGSRMVVHAAGPGLLVVAESWDPGWAARVDGKPTPILRVNDVQIGVPLTKGTHRVTLRYRARGLRAGLGLMAVTALGFGAALGAGRSRRPRS